jgi:hypothetical protein
MSQQKSANQLQLILDGIDPAAKRGIPSGFADSTAGNSPNLLYDGGIG